MQEYDQFLYLSCSALFGWSLCGFWLVAQYLLHFFNLVRIVDDHSASSFIWSS